VEVTRIGSNTRDAAAAQSRKRMNVGEGTTVLIVNCRPLFSVSSVKFVFWQSTLSIRFFRDRSKQSVVVRQGTSAL
jgi:hypothetical protein